ncbi:MAG TPA: ABC-type transport auxiliary lipoprotein family protein [Alphaproteobacteria bacterium]|nr:ABC-type transport auxiliary lipoprotein family protein [Alphaproteobacteria bacterium]
MIRRLLLFLPLFAAGCGGLLAPSGPSPALYRLDAPRAVSAAGPAAPWQLLIDKPTATLALDTTRIAIVPAPNRMDYYADVAWADKAPAMLQELILQAFDRSGRIQAVQRQGGGLKADYILAVDLQDFEVDAASSPANVHVRLTGRLVRTRDRAIVASRMFDTTAPIGSGGFDGVIASFNQAVSELLPELVGWTLAEGGRNP